MSDNLEKVGWVLILNNETFDNNYMQKRDGSECDVKKLMNVFNLLDFRMEVVKDPTLQHIQNIMNQLLVEDLSNALCLVIVIMSHGKQSGMMAARDQWYNIEKEILYAKVFETDNLPKIVIRQSCKTACNSQTGETTCTNKNILCLDSTFVGLESQRYEDGSPFIEILCTNLTKSGHMMKINNIASNIIEEFHTHYNLPQQIPVVKDFNFKDICIGIRAGIKSEQQANN